MKDKRIDERMFRIYCGIKAIVGKSELKRVTIKRIKYAMFGYKSETVYSNENKKEEEKVKLNKRYKNKMPVLLRVY